MFENADDHRVPELPSTALSGDNNALSCDDADATFPNAKSVPPPAGCTTPVCADVAGAPAPEPFDAVTRARIVEHGNTEICRVDVAASPAPVWAKTSKEEQVFFVRLNNSTRALPEDEAATYRSQRWDSP